MILSWVCSQLGHQTVWAKTWWKLGDVASILVMCCKHNYSNLCNLPFYILLSQSWNLWWLYDAICKTSLLPLKLSSAINNFKKGDNYCKYSFFFVEVWDSDEDIETHLNKTRIFFPNFLQQFIGEASRPWFNISTKADKVRNNLNWMNKTLIQDKLNNKQSGWPDWAILTNACF